MGQSQERPQGRAGQGRAGQWSDGMGMGRDGARCRDASSRKIGTAARDEMGLRSTPPGLLGCWAPGGLAAVQPCSRRVGAGLLDWTVRADAWGQGWSGTRRHVWAFRNDAQPTPTRSPLAARRSPVASRSLAPHTTHPRALGPKAALGPGGAGMPGRAGWAGTQAADQASGNQRRPGYCCDKAQCSSLASGQGADGGLGRIHTALSIMTTGDESGLH